MIGALVFLGCPLRMVLRMGGGDLNALVGLAGFVIGILIGIVFLKRGFGLKRSYPAKLVEGPTLPVVMFVLLVLVLAVPAIFHASEAGPGSMHAPAIVSLLIALVVGAMASLPSSLPFSSAIWRWAASSWASICSPSLTAATCGICWAWFWWAGVACCWAAAPCVS